MDDLEDILENMGLELTEKEFLKLVRKLQADGKCLKQTQLFQQGQVGFFPQSTLVTSRRQFFSVATGRDWLVVTLVTSE